MKIITPTKVLDHVKDAYIRYYDSAFWLREEKLLEERRQLLSASGVATQDLLLEAVPSYPSTVSIIDACSPLGIGEDVAAALGKIVFGSSDVHLRHHQAQALATSLGKGKLERNVVVTSGTGSGKTESFLLPVLAQLLQDRLGTPLQSINPWWEPVWSSQKNWAGLRPLNKSGPKPAVRAMLLYPTNALVEDQISRLRRAAVNAQELTGGDPLFYFGRYTGATEGRTWRPPESLLGKDRKIIEGVADYLRGIAREADRLRLKNKDDMDTRMQFSDPSCGEMLTRWDMISAPPDIFITNIISS